MPQAIWTFGTNAAVFIAMPAFGSWIDTTNRSVVITAAIVIQNICVIISSILLFFIGTAFPKNPKVDWQFALCFAGCLISSMLGQIMGMGATLALEKDWVVVLCQGHKSLLTTINSRMRRIDLFCKLVAPALFGIVTQYLGDTPQEKIRYGSAWVMGWNVIGLFLEYTSIRKVYVSNPILASHALKGEHDDGKKPLNYGAVNAPDPEKGDDDVVNNSRNLVVNQGSINQDTGLMNHPKPQKSPKKVNNFTKIARGWGFYRKSVMLWASIAYCMLYFSVLNSGSLVAAYLRTEGISYAVLGITKGIGAIMGILGTYLTPMMANKCGCRLEFIGVITIWMFWLCLVPAGIQFTAQRYFDLNIFPGNQPVDDAYVILVCMIVARCGLWAFDLAENQMMQERVEQSINGVQVSVSQLFVIAMAVFGMAFSNTADFYILVYMTLGMILGACLVYSVWYCCDRRRSIGYSALE